MVDCMEAYFSLVESFVEDWRENARKYYGCRGTMSGVCATTSGKHLHWSEHFPGLFWTAGAGWLAHWFYEHYLYTGDREFLIKRAVPFMKEVALFYEDFLFEDSSHTYRFSPSYSPENGNGPDNATMDIAVAKEVLTNLISACGILEIEADSIRKWKEMLSKMPPYLINEEGALQEWIIPGYPDHYNHRHFSHLYPLFQSFEFSPEYTPELWEASRVALHKRLDHWTACTSSHGRMHAALCAVRLGEGDTALSLLSKMATGRSMYPSLVTAHYENEAVFNVDANGAIPEVINNMLVFSLPGVLDVLPALPKDLTKGAISGVLCRGQICIERLAWNQSAGTVKLELTSGVEQSITVRLPRQVEMLTIDGKGVDVVYQDDLTCIDMDLPLQELVVLQAKYAD
jgi:alpha-L-fucosidase 2